MGVGFARCRYSAVGCRCRAVSIGAGAVKWWG